MNTKQTSKNIFTYTIRSAQKTEICKEHMFFANKRHKMQSAMINQIALNRDDDKKLVR